MPRAEGSLLDSSFHHCKLTNRSRNAEMGCQQDEIKGPTAPAVVLPGLRKAMPRRERLQDARRLRVPFATDDRRWRECRAAHRRLFSAVPKRICHASLPSVRLLYISLLSTQVSDDIFQKIRYKARQGQQRLPGIYPRQGSPTYELHALGDSH